MICSSCKIEYYGDNICSYCIGGSYYLLCSGCLNALFCYLDAPFVSVLPVKKALNEFFMIGNAVRARQILHTIVSDVDSYYKPLDVISDIRELYPELVDLVDEALSALDCG